MAQNVTVAGASYSDVPSVVLPTTGGGDSSFYDVSDTTATDADVITGKYFYTANGTRSAGSATIPTKVSDLNNDLGFVDATGAANAAPVQSVNGSTGTVTLSIPSNTSDLTNDSGFITGMTILSYGHSTWAEFLAAYTANKVVYTRASSNSNPASGSQTRLAFMAYVNNADPASITNVEFQYYRSVNAHSATQQGDQVYVYKLDKNSGWTVTVRESYTKIVAGTGLTSSYSNGVLTISLA